MAMRNYGNQRGMATATQPATPPAAPAAPQPFDRQTSALPGAFAPTASPADTAVSAPTPSYTTKGFDQRKIDAGHDSPKYQFRNVASKYDPSQGIPQAMLDELNQLGIATFSSNGRDKINVGGNIDPRFGGITSFDVIENYHGDGPKAWQWGALGGPDGSGGGPGGAVAQSPSASQALAALMSGGGGPFGAQDVRQFGGQAAPVDVTAGAFPSERDVLTSLMRRPG